MNVDARLKELFSYNDIDSYWITAPHDATAPFITYQMVIPQTIRTHSGNVAEKPRYQIDCWAYSETEVQDLASMVRELIDLNRIDFHLATRENERPMSDPDTSLFRVMFEFDIWNIK